jgi:hypothetical protein
MCRYFSLQIFVFSLLSFCSGNQLMAQPFHPVMDLAPADKYAVVNPLVKKLGIRSITDSSEFIKPSGMNIKYYDSAGRLIAQLDHPADRIQNPYQYLYRGDTIYRLRFINDSLLASYQRYVFDKKGLLLSYLDCGNYYLKKDSYYAAYEVFRYNEKKQLKSRTSYTREDYPGSLSINEQVATENLNSSDRVNYQYLRLKKGRECIVGKYLNQSNEMVKTDSIFYDQQKRILRLVSYEPKGTIGEQVYNDLTHTSTREYTPNKVVAIFQYTYCRASDSLYGCIDQVELDKEKEEIIYHPNGTLQAIYGFYPSGEKYVVDRFFYRFY